MGNNASIKECIFTNKIINPIINGVAATEYYISINNKEHFIRYISLNNEDSFFVQKKNIFYGLLYNDDWFEDENTIITIENLKELLDSKVLPITPEEKLERTFLKLFSFQNEDGGWLSLDNIFYDEVLWKILYFKSLRELNYYVEVLDSEKLIQAQFSKSPIRTNLLEQFRITFSGLSYEIKLKQEGDKSNKCFVAMSFKPETIEIRNAIKEALMSTGFEALIIDEQFIDSDKTINDEIIANLKRCKFCIADFTFHSLGVYFESGHALGQGKKVIYTCREDEFHNAHFDIRPLQHIIYSSPAKLTKELTNKIEAWVK